ncbi:sigma 54-interacting transcriptional regulator, partial [Phaeospirillum tilakii]
IAYSSVAHMAIVTIGLFAFNRQGLEGAMIVMLSHGLVSAALFLCVGVIYDRLHTREISRYGGLAINMPRYALLFMAVNCAAISDDLLQSELFGHRRGTFTGATTDRLGLLQAADGGTVFLDEISEISPSMQVSLLRFLQEGEVRPIGSDQTRRCDVRIVAACNRPLRQLVDEGKFRQDLYYRLRGFELRIPPLRERPDDIPPLVAHMIEKYGRLTSRRVAGLT